MLVRSLYSCRLLVSASCFEFGASRLVGRDSFGVCRHASFAFVARYLYEDLTEHGRAIVARNRELQLEAEKHEQEAAMQKEMDAKQLPPAKRPRKKL